MAKDISVRYRALRDTTDSKRVNALSYSAEVLFYRLMMKCDVMGRFDADPILIKSQCFPRKDALRTSDIDRWLQELSSPYMDEETRKQLPALVRLYTLNGKRLLQINDFRQTELMKWEKPRYPPPPEEKNSSPPFKRSDSDIERESESESDAPAHGVFFENKFFYIGKDRIDLAPSDAAQSTAFKQRTDHLLMNGISGVDPVKLWQRFDEDYTYWEFEDRNHFLSALKTTGINILKAERKLEKKIARTLTIQLPKK